MPHFIGKRLSQRLSRNLLLVSIQAFCLLLSLTCPVLSIPGKYITFPILTNKRLPPGKALSNITGFSKHKDCEERCIKHPQCEAYAHNPFSRVCHLHELLLGTPAIKETAFTLYVRSKPESEEYYAFGTHYIKLILERMNIYNARKMCQSLDGDLVAVRSQELNDLLLHLINKHYIWEAFIGVTDEEKEGEWRYIEHGSGLVTWNAWENDLDIHPWERRDYNCAVIKISGEWGHTMCTGLRYFFCQVPMY